MGSPVSLTWTGRGWAELGKSDPENWKCPRAQQAAWTAQEEELTERGIQGGGLRAELNQQWTQPLMEGHGLKQGSYLQPEQ